jgi:hypothetical protein
LESDAFSAMAATSWDLERALAIFCVFRWLWLLWFVYKSHVTWLELKNFAGFTQAKKHKKSPSLQGLSTAGLDFEG